MYQIIFDIGIKAHQEPTDSDLLRLQAEFPLRVFSQLAQLFGFQYQESVFYYYPDEVHETQGIDVCGLEVRLQRRVQRLKSAVYFQLILENAFHLVNDKPGHLLLQSNLNIELVS